MRHRAVGVESGDRVEAQAHEAAAPRARRRELLVDGQLGDALAAGRRAGLLLRQGGLEPGVELAHRGAVLGHRLAHEAGLGGTLAALQQRARVDRLDHRGSRADLLAQAQRDALRVDEQDVAGAERGQRGAGFFVGREADAVGRERGAQRGADLARADEQRRRGTVDQQVGEEHRVVADVAAAQVRDPRDVVDGRDEVVGGAGARHRFAHRRELGAARERRVRRAVLVDRLRRQVRAIGPDRGQQVEVGPQHDAGAFECLAQGLRRRQAEHLAVHCDGLPGRCMGGEPVDVQRRAAGRDLHQLDAGAGEFGLGLHPVATVGEQGRAVDRHDQRAHRTGEARQPLPALPALGQVFADRCGSLDGTSSA